MQSEKNNKKTSHTGAAERPPIVVIMGHIDHGKTTLLDFIRQTNVAAHESGNITQHIGAYEVEHAGKRITFLDTPGHESFSRMRARGARVADVAVLVVAADDGVKPQTVEAIRAAKEAGIPYLIAINKIDKPAADPNRVKGELAEHEVLVEGWGGTVPVAEISAKEGTGVSELLDLILLSAEMEELAADAEHAGSGVVIESHRDSRRGAVATLLIKDGAVRRGDWISSGKECAPIRIMEDSTGNAVEDASFSSPVRVLGFSAPPGIGETFTTHANKKSAEDFARSVVADTRATDEQKVPTEGEEHAVEVPLIIKADVAGSAEAVEHEIEKLASSALHINVLRSDVGDITDDDIKSVSGAEGTIIAGFKVNVTPSAAALAERYGVTMHTSGVIYELLDWLRAELESRLPKEVARTDEGMLKVLKVFKQAETAVVFGGMVTSGVLRTGSAFDILRGKERVGTGTIKNIQSGKIDTKEVAAGSECGLSANITGRIAAGDIISAYTETETAGTL
jgi:translation initiation factor IF-2